MLYNECVICSFKKGVFQMKKLLAILLALILMLSLCACNKDEPDGNVPDNVISPSEDVTTSAEGDDSPAVSSSEVTDVSNPDEDVPSDTSDHEDETPTTSATDDDEEIIIDDEPEEEPEVDIAEIIDIHEYMAFEHLYLLNSDKVHAKFMEVISYDGEYVIGTDREFFVNGTNTVYINGSEKIIIDEDTVWVCDTDSMTYYSYENDHSEDSYDRFGYGILNYGNVSVSEEDGIVTEIFEIRDGESVITSTWTFYDDGSFTVYDSASDSDGYYYYTFEFADEDVSDMDLNIPDGCEEVDADEYEGF